MTRTSIEVHIIDLHGARQIIVLCHSYWPASYLCLMNCGWRRNPRQCTSASGAALPLHRRNFVLWWHLGMQWTRIIRVVVLNFQVPFKISHESFFRVEPIVHCKPDRVVGVSFKFGLFILITPGDSNSNFGKIPWCLY